MENKENEKESNETIISENNIKIPIYLNGEKYIINIYPSKDNINIIFKLEKVKIITYYFFAKFDLKDFQKINKIFIFDKNINDIFTSLNLLCRNYIINLESTNKEYKMIIVFQSKENKKIKFTLFKKIVSQEKINPLLGGQIEDNKIKLNILRNQIIKIEKSSKLKNEIISKIKVSLSNINNKLNNISTINLNNLNISNSTVSTKNSSSIETISNPENNNNINNIEDDYPEEKDIKKENEKEIEKEKEKEKDKNTQNTQNKKEKEKDNKNANNNNNNTFFCYDSSQNKKIIEFLIILNVVTILIVLYILGSNHNLRINLEFEPQYYESDNERLGYLSYMDNSRNNDNFRDIFQENLDMQKNMDEGGITNSKVKKEFIENKKKKLQDRIYNLYEY
jgi:hypothetical protein